jgi:hypothetical protein
MKKILDRLKLGLGKREQSGEPHMPSLIFLDIRPEKHIGATFHFTSVYGYVLIR